MSVAIAERTDWQRRADEAYRAARAMGELLASRRARNEASAADLQYMIGQEARFSGGVGIGQLAFLFAERPELPEVFAAQASNGDAETPLEYPSRIPPYHADTRDQAERVRWGLDAMSILSRHFDRTVTAPVGDGQVLQVRPAMDLHEIQQAFNAATGAVPA
jgi:hypothetical protein